MEQMSMGTGTATDGAGMNRSETESGAIGPAAQNEGRSGMTAGAEALDWEAEIRDEAPEYTVLEPGEYMFTVEKAEMGRYQGGGKIGRACDRVTLTLRVDTDAGTAWVRDSFFLLTTWAWKIRAFYKCIGMLKDGGSLKMCWKNTPGYRGKALLDVREFTDRDGQLRRTNRVKRYLEYDMADQMTETEEEVPW